MFELEGVVDTERIATLTYSNAAYQFFLEPGKIQLDIKQGQI